MPRRRAGSLLPLEREILRAGIDIGADGSRFHGFGLAEALGSEHGGRLIAHGILYKALARMLEAGLLAAAWEDHDVAEQAKRPRRKLYAVTATGAAALEAAERPAPAAFRAMPSAGAL